jgi:1,4-alpha-glucan branching enzyme
MKHYLFPSLFFLLCLQTISGQVVTSDPAFPSQNDPATIYFHASEGDGGLANYDGEIYAHTGVITENSSSGSDWKYVKNDWAVNSADVTLTKISANEYSLEISPSIREYYGVPAGEEILQMAFVFRDSEGNITGKDNGGLDIFVDLYTGDFKVSIISPESNRIISLASQINFLAAATESAEIELLLNGSSIKTEETASLSHLFTFDTPGDNWIKVIATANDISSSDSVFIYVIGDQEVAALPEGLNDGINYIDDNTVQLVFYAPGKEHVFVVGDFNNWIPSNSYRMKKDGDRYWLSIENLTAGIEYVYQYVIDGELYLADPYTEKVLDPWNDPWIDEATYPDLIDYPSEYASGLASVIETGQAEFLWENQDYSAPAKENLVIYELLVRDFIEYHNWNTLTDTLDYFTALGITAIELMPINEFEGNESWGYNPSFYFAPDKYYGPAEDLKKFIDACHGRGIAVIMDMTLNHSFSQSPLVQLYFEGGKASAENPWYNVDSPNDVYFWGYDFNHESIATQNFVDRVTSHWLTEYDIDGFRFDFTKGFTNTPGDGWAYDASRINLLKRMADYVWSVNPNAYVILEHFTDLNEEKLLSDYGMMIWANANGVYNEATMGYHDNGKSNFSWASYLVRNFSYPHQVTFMESHDEERLMFKNLAYGNSSDSYDIKSLNTALARIELAATFFFTVPGPKMIWQFGELGYDFSIDENGRVGNKPIRWDYLDVPARKRLLQVFTALIELKNEEPAFSTNNFTMHVADALKRIELNHSDMDVRIIGNFDVVSRFADPSFSKTGTWYEFFTGNEIDVSDVNAEIQLAPGKYSLYTTKKLDTPEIIASAKENSFENFSLKLFPVPAKDFLSIENEKSMEHIIVYDLNGRKVLAESLTSTEHALDISILEPGMYLLHVIDKDNSTLTGRFVKQ